MIAFFQTFDSIFHFLPPAARAGLYGLVVGTLAMLIYWKLSPQKKLAQLKIELTNGRRAMNAYTGSDFREMMRLSRHTIAIALKQVLLVLGPTLVAAIPVIGAMAWIDLPSPMWQVGPEWMRSWHTPFMIGVSVAALVMKFGFKIL